MRMQYDDTQKRHRSSCKEEQDAKIHTHTSGKSVRMEHKVSVNAFQLKDRGRSYFMDEKK